MAKKNERSGSSTWKGNDAETSSPERRDKASEPLYFYSTASWNGAPNNKPYQESNAESDKKDLLWGPQEIWEKNADSASVVQKIDDDETRDGRWLLTVKGVNFCFYQIPAGKFSMGFDFDQRLPECAEKRKCEWEKKRGKWKRAFCSRNKKRPLYCYIMPDSEAARRTVKITRDFWLMDTTVTVAAFDVFLRATGRVAPKGAYGFDDKLNEIRFDKEYHFMNPGFPNFDRSLHKASYPATCVDWCDATAFCDWLTEEMRNSRRHGVNGDKTLVFRLPTEAEWEFACRCGTSEAYSFGDNIAKLAKFGNYDGKDGFLYVAPVKSFFANDFGLYDMHGNVWEWCADWYAPYAATWLFPLKDPSGPNRGVLRTVRGGSWDNVAEYCRSATRGAAAPWVRAVNLGFRVAMDVYEF